MDERKWTGVIICILILGGLLIYSVSYWNKKRLHTLAYKDCKVHFHYYYNVDTTDMAYPIANNKLALCLCQAYIKTKNKGTAGRIMEIYKAYDVPFGIDSSKYGGHPGIDTILKYKTKVFDTVISLD
jgi:hypothetical protein